MRYTNKHNLPDPVFRALTDDKYDKGGADLSVTQIIDSPRISLMRQIHDDDIEVDAIDQLWSVFGTAVHNIFEEYAEGEYEAEERLYLDTQGLTVSGAMDIQQVGKHQKIWDYKITSAFTLIFGSQVKRDDGSVVYLGKKEWENQLNVYAHLRRKGYRKDDAGKDTIGAHTDGLRIIALLRDWQQSKAAMDPSYPQMPIALIRIPVWSPEEQERYFEERVAVHREAREVFASDGILPLCSDEERWQKDAKWAVMKRGNKRALRLLDSEADAKAYAGDDKKLYIEERLGQAVRCEKNFCNVAPWCDQFLHGLEAG
jgi:hypothetical protein